MPSIAWAPKSLAAPFDNIPNDFLPYKNAWRYLLIFGIAWLYSTGLAMGFVERADVIRWATLLGVNGAVLAAVCLVHRATREPLTLWHYADTFDFTGSPVFFYKNHNGAYLAAMLALVLGLALFSSSRIRLCWEIVALALLAATAAVNSRVAFACGCVWMFIYGFLRCGSFILRARSGVTFRWVTGLIIAAAIFTFTILATGGRTVIARFMDAKSAPISFIGGGTYRGLTRDLALEMWKDRPVWGWGGGAFIYLFPTYNPRVPQIAADDYALEPDLNRLFGPTANCDWVEFLVEYGIVGVSLMVAVMGLRLVQWTRQRGWSCGASLFFAAGSAGIVIHSFYDYILRNPALLLLCLALQIAALRLAYEENENDSANIGAKLPFDS